LAAGDDPTENSPTDAIASSASLICCTVMDDETRLYSFRLFVKRSQMRRTLSRSLQANAWATNFAKPGMLCTSIDVVFTTLSVIARIPNAEVVFDYGSRPRHMRPSDAPAMRR
jgi:hypothetical protein